MTPPNSWPSGTDYDEWLLAARAGIARRGYLATSAEAAVDAIAPLLAKAVEEAEADAERLYVQLYPVGLGAHGPDKRCDPQHGCKRCDALAAHEARKAGR